MKAQSRKGIPEFFIMRIRKGRRVGCTAIGTPMKEEKEEKRRG